MTQDQKTLNEGRLLLIGPTPPPYAGPEIGTQLLLDSSLTERFEVLHLDTTVRQTNASKGKLDITAARAYLTFVYKLIKFFLFSQPDLVVYLPTSATYLGWVRDSTTIFITKILFRRPLILQFRGGHFKLFYNQSSRFFQLFLRTLLRRCDRILVQGHALKSQFTHIIPDRKIAVLHNGVKTRKFQEILDVSEKNSDSLQVLFVGHLSYAKGYCDLLKVIPKLSASKGKLEFLFMGTEQAGEERNVFYNQITGDQLDHKDPNVVYKKYIESNNLESRIIYLGGEVHGKQKLQTFVTSDIFVLPSYSEGFPMAVLEALAAGLPIVTTPVGALPEIITPKQNGFLVQPGNLAELEEKLRILINNEGLRARISRTNIAKAQDQFDIANTAEKLARISLQVLESNRTTTKRN